MAARGRDYFPRFRSTIADGHRGIRRHESGAGEVNGESFLQPWSNVRTHRDGRDSGVADERNHLDLGGFWISR